MKLALIFCLICSASCSTTPAHTLSPCTSPPAPPSGSSCSVASAYLSCTYEDEAGVEQHESCLAANINNCDDGSGLGGCNSECPDVQYAAVCPGNDPPSPSCSSIGNGVYCCPCGS